ncbi:DnaJ domain [Trypanosoma vivax]|uniref:Putative chaperone protein DNAj n=1 Tax=Trypanosoma vivax (strain Y486) TaxID=1055687 RepID=G0U403_TRYVY|nr:putative chaperone protein DNAj [Trypanosoma vivax]KAH8612105.1 DnaJ domain [Trypanosoma vivax]CCC52165.1 putative chaperone protein DNAj [Trypanosoma vivax Y486]
MQDAKPIQYPSSVLLAYDDRMRQFVDAGVLHDWDEALRDWRAQKNAQIAFEKQRCMFHSTVPGAENRPVNFSNEEFFHLTRQLEDINASLVGPAAPSIPDGSGDVSPPDTQCDLFTLDQTMYTDALNTEQLEACQRGEEMYKRGKYEEAADAFSSVIDTCLPRVLNVAMLSNRAACYLRASNYKLSYRDSIRSCEMDSRYTLGVRRALRSQICRGECAEAKKLISKYSASCKCPFSEELEQISLYESYSALLEANDHTMALKHLNTLLDRVPCASFEALKTQLLAVEGGNQEALRHVEQSLISYPSYPELLYWRAQLRFLECASVDELVSISVLFSVVVSQDYAARFRHAKQRVEQCIDMYRVISSAYESKEWLRVINLGSSAVQKLFLGDQLRAVVLAKRARALYHMKRFYECMDDISIALRATSKRNERAELLLLRALSEENVSRWSDALRSVELSIHENRTTEALEVRKRIMGRTANSRQRRQDKEGDKNTWKGSARPNVPHSVAEHYECLALPPGAGAERIKKSYRALAMKWHPDRWCGAQPQLQKEAEEMFKKVKTAYDELMATTGV